jgi:acyl-CoA thioesterase FadM
MLRPEVGVTWLLVDSRRKRQSPQTAGNRLQYAQTNKSRSRLLLPRVKPDPRRLDPHIYPYKIDIQARFADMDPQWHLNNVRIAEFYQEARISFNHALSEEFDLERTPDQRVLVARQSIDYLGEVQWPGVLSVGIGVSHLGGSSFSFGLALFQASRCVGISDAVLVYATQQGPARIPDRLREVLTHKVLRSEWLFSYGTLQDPAVQQANFGRALDGRRDTLPGYAVSSVTIRDLDVIRTSGKSTHAIIDPSHGAGDEVAGTVYPLTPQELAAADRYEVAEYKRVAVAMKSGLQAWAYVRA